MKKTISIIGAGKVGTAIAFSLKRKKNKIYRVIDKSLESSQKAIEFIGDGIAGDNLEEQYKNIEDIIFITTPDCEIEQTCNIFSIGRKFKSNSIIIHCSGVLTSQVLLKAKATGASIASMHPIQTFADVRQAVDNLPKTFWGIEGDQAATTNIKELVEEMEGKPLIISSEDKPLYHAAATIASNYFVSLIDVSLRLYEKIGVNQDTAIKALLPLLKGTIKNIESLGVPQALTGPIVRGDNLVIQEHINVIRDNLPLLLEIYNVLGRYTVDLGIAKGSLNKNKADSLLELFD